MTFTLNALEAVSVRAFLEALAQLNKPLPPELQQEINQVGQIFAIHPKEAVDRLLDLAQHECLNPLYKQARLDIQKQYVPGEQNIFLSLDEEDSSDTPPPETVENVMAVILASRDSREEAKKQSSKFKELFARWFRGKNE